MDRHRRTKVDMGSMLLTVIYFIFLTEINAYTLPSDVEQEDKLLNRSDGVNTNAVATYGFSIIRNTTIPCEKTEQMSFRYHPLTDNDKLAILSTGGGSYVKEYMAKNAEEAEENFINLLGISLLSKTKKATRSSLHMLPRTKKDVLEMLRQKQVTQSKRTENGINGTVTAKDEAHKNGEDKIQDDHMLESKRDEQPTDDLSSSLPFLLPSDMGMPSPKAISGEEVISYNYCQNRGQRTRDGYYLYMCTTCASTTNLGEAYWPPIVNEAVRLGDDPYCFIADGIPQGECMQKIMPMNMLYRRPGFCSLALKDGETVIVDDWAPYTRELKIGCECVMDATSNFAQYVGKYN